MKNVFKRLKRKRKNASSSTGNAPPSPDNASPKLEESPARVVVETNDNENGNENGNNGVENVNSNNDISNDVSVTVSEEQEPGEELAPAPVTALGPPPVAPAIPVPPTAPAVPAVPAALAATAPSTWRERRRFNEHNSLLHNLPSEILLEIFTRFSFFERLAVRQTCSRFAALITALDAKQAQKPQEDQFGSYQVWRFPLTLMHHGIRKEWRKLLRGDIARPFPPPLPGSSDDVGVASNIDSADCVVSADNADSAAKQQDRLHGHLCKDCQKFQESGKLVARMKWLAKPLMCYGCRTMHPRGLFPAGVRHSSYDSSLSKLTSYRVKVARAPRPRRHPSSLFRPYSAPARFRARLRDHLRHKFRAPFTVFVSQNRPQRECIGHRGSFQMCPHVNVTYKSMEEHIRDWRANFYIRLRFGINNPGANLGIPMCRGKAVPKWATWICPERCDFAPSIPESYNSLYMRWDEVDERKVDSTTLALINKHENEPRLTKPAYEIVGSRPSEIVWLPNKAAMSWGSAAFRVDPSVTPSRQPFRDFLAAVKTVQAQGKGPSFCPHVQADDGQLMLPLEPGSCTCFGDYDDDDGHRNKPDESKRIGEPGPSRIPGNSGQPKKRDDHRQYESAKSVGGGYKVQHHQHRSSFDALPIPQLSVPMSGHCMHRCRCDHEYFDQYPRPRPLLEGSGPPDGPSDPGPSDDGKDGKGKGKEKETASPQPTRQASGTTDGRALTHRYQCGTCHALYLWRREADVVHLEFYNTVKQAEPDSMLWIRMLDPHSWDITKDQETKHVYWCPNKGCKTNFRWQRMYKRMMLLERGPYTDFTSWL